MHAVSTTKNQKKTIEESLSDLEKLVAELENGELELDQALKKVRTGSQIIQRMSKNPCRNRDEDKNSYGR